MATAGSLALLLGAWGFQHLGGLAPCAMCLWQRWPHAAALVFGAGALAAAGAARAAVAMLGAGAALVTAGIGVFHTGVERGWWPGPTSCSGGGAVGSMPSATDLLATEGTATAAMCDAVVWSFAGLSMASWNALLSIGLAAVWLAAAGQAWRGRARSA